MVTATAVIFPWRDEYSVGILAIDTQHKGLVKLINDLHAAMAAGKGKEALAVIIDELVRYTERHFSDEEAMLKTKGFPGLEAHHKVHVELTRQVLELREKFRSSKLAITIEVMQFLKRWLASHILQHDQEYAKALR